MIFRTHLLFLSAICQYYQGSTNSFTSNGIDSSFELLPNRTTADVCKISTRSKPVFTITNNRVACKFVVSAASVLPYSGLLGTFQETVDCTGAMSGLGTLCDGCDVCKGNGSTCRADCDNAVASGRKYDDCNFCGGSTFYYPNQRDGLPWNPTLTIDDVSPSIAMSDFQATYCSGMFQQPSDICLFPVTHALQQLTLPFILPIQTTLSLRFCRFRIPLVSGLIFVSGKCHRSSQQTRPG